MRCQRSPRASGPSSGWGAPGGGGAGGWGPAPEFPLEPAWDGRPGRGRFAERLHALWDVSIDARAEALHDPMGSEGRMARRRTAHAGAIAGLWPELAGDAAAVVERLWG